jgi:hypothetical protein
VEVAVAARAALEEGLARAPVEVAVAARAALEEGLARAPVEVAAAARAALEEGLARAPVEVAVAQVALEEVAQAGQERVAAIQATMDQVPVDQAPVGRAAGEDQVQAAEALPVAVVSGARGGNPVNGWRLPPCCAAPRWAGWGEQEASAPP